MDLYRVHRAVATVALRHHPDCEVVSGGPLFCDVRLSQSAASSLSLAFPGHVNKTEGGSDEKSEASN